MERLRFERLVIEFLRDEIANPLPEYMLAMIAANRGVETQHTLPEGTLAKFGSEIG